MAYNYSGFTSLEVYSSVINDVTNNVKDAFLDDGVDLDVLESLKKSWMQKVEASGCVDRKPNKPHFMPPPIRGVTVPALRMHTGQTGYQLQNPLPPKYTTPDGIELIPVQYNHIAHQMIRQPNVTYIPPQPAVFLQPPSDGQENIDIRSGIPHSSMYQFDGNGERDADEETSKDRKKRKVSKKEDEKALSQLMRAVQLDGNGAGMSDSSSEDEDFDPLRRLADRVGNDIIPDDDADMAEDEAPLNSDDDEQDANYIDNLFDNVENVIVCQFEKINRTRTKWKMNLKDGIMHISNRDHCFNKAQGEATF